VPSGLVVSVGAAPPLDGGSSLSAVIPSSCVSRVLFPRKTASFQSITLSPPLGRLTMKEVREKSCGQIFLTNVDFFEFRSHNGSGDASTRGASIKRRKGDIIKAIMIGEELGIPNVSSLFLK